MCIINESLKNGIQQKKLLRTFEGTWRDKEAGTEAQITQLTERSEVSLTILLRQNYNFGA